MSVVSTVERFYADVVQHLKPWTPSPPKVKDDQPSPAEENTATGTICGKWLAEDRSGLAVRVPAGGTHHVARRRTGAGDAAPAGVEARESAAG